MFILFVDMRSVDLLTTFCPPSFYFFFTFCNSAFNKLIKDKNNTKLHITNVVIVDKGYFLEPREEFVHNHYM